MHYRTILMIFHFIKIINYLTKEEVKEYVYELAKHGIRRYNEAKKTKLLKKVAQL